MKKMKKYLYGFLTAVLLLTATFLFSGANSSVEAASGYSVSLERPEQTAWGTTTAEIKWSISYESSYNTTTTASYNIYIGESYNEMTLVGSTANTYYTLNNLTDGKEYLVKVEPVAANGSVGYPSSGYIETIPATVKNFHQERWYYFIHVLDVAWDRIDTADKITVTLYNSKGKKVGKSQELSGSSTSTSFSNMKDEVYTVKVQASKTVNGKTYTTAVSSIQCFNQARITSAKVSKKKLTVRWSKVGGATGYNIYVSTKPTTGYKKVKSVGKNVTKVTIPKLKGKAFSSKKTYYVYVETKKKNGKKVNTSGHLYYWNTKNTGYGYF